MKAKLTRDAPRTWVLVFDVGDEVIAALEAFAREHGLGASHFYGIGAFERATLGYFDWERKDYDRILIDEQVEVLALSGFVTESPQGPKIHSHVALGRRDASVRGGHLMQGHVRPTLELVLTDDPHRLRRRVDPTTGLPLIDLTD